MAGKADGSRLKAEYFKVTKGSQQEDNVPERKCELQTEKTGKLTISYAGLTVPGLDPGRTVKCNQDCLSFCEMSEGGCHLAAVFDGHGKNGTMCSQYIAKNLVPCIIENIEKKRSATDGWMQQLLLDSFKEINDKLLQENGRFCKLSGSTGVSVILDSRAATLHVANVGDSRAILGSVKNGSVTATRLTVDHKPDDNEERRRITNMGGLIHPFCVDGEYIGPARVWTSEDASPGLAMSRSFGDAMGRTVGVVSEPYYYAHDISENDTYLVLCSDGVTEFMQDEEVIHLIHKGMYDATDKSHGKSLVRVCASLIAESRKRWSDEEDDVADDCTALIICFNH